MGTTRRTYHGLPHYITGLGEGVSSNNNNNNNNNNNKLESGDQNDDAYVSYLRKTARDRSFPQQQQLQHHHRMAPEPFVNAAVGLVQQQQQPPSGTTNAADDAKWGYYYSLQDHPSNAAIGPWQIAAFCLLGAVILLSALFLHILADGSTTTTTTTTSSNHHHADGSSYQSRHHHNKNNNNAKQQQQRRRSSARRSIKKKKTDEWSDDASDVEANLLSDSVRGRPGAYRTTRSDSFEEQAATAYAYNESSLSTTAAATTYAAPKYFPQQLSRHRKNSSATQQQQHNYPQQSSSQQQQQQQQQSSQQAGGGTGRIYQNAYRCPTPSSRLKSSSNNNNIGAFSPSIVHRTVTTPALAGPPMPNHSGEGGVRVFSSASSMESFGNSGGVGSGVGESSLHSNNSSGHHHQYQVPPPMLQPRQLHNNMHHHHHPAGGSSLRSGGRKSSPTVVTIREPIRTAEKTRTPDVGPRDLLLAPAVVMDKTPRVRNGNKIVNALDTGGAAVGTPTSSPARAARDQSRAEIDSGTEDNNGKNNDGPIVMPYLPNLNPSLGSVQPQQQQQQQQEPVDMGDLHLYTMMESGNVYWRRTPSPRQPSPRPSGSSNTNKNTNNRSTSTPSSSRQQPRPPSPDRMAFLLQPPPLLTSTSQQQQQQQQGPPSFKGEASEHVLEMSESLDDSESLDSNDPRKNIQHKRDSLINFTDAAASLQGAIDFDELELREVIGGGGFGQVWKAMWRGTPVAVKVLTGSAQAHHVPRAILEEFAAEINLLKGMRHPNICLYMGACLAPPNRAIITELAANGSLWDALRLPLMPPFSPSDGVTRHAWPMCLYQPDRRHGIPPSMTNMRTVPHVAPKGSWPWVLVKRVACGSARGMAYLHSGTPPVLHRDLKSANILLDESYTPKVCDFGLSRLKAQDRSMTGNCGTVQWMAPEVLANQSYNEKADIYSYGIILWELLTRQCPYDEMSAIQCALAVLNKNHRPEIPRWCPPALQVLIRSCLKKNPDERPNYPEILQALDEMP